MDLIVGLGNGDSALNKIKYFIAQQNELALQTLIEVYAGEMLHFSSNALKEEFKFIWNHELGQDGKRIVIVQSPN